MPELDRRELATMLAALRHYQAVHCNPTVYDDFTAEIHDIASDGDTLEPLNAAEIDALCERLNRSEPSTACAICGKQPDPFSDGHNEHDESIGAHWICERCVTNKTPEEIADHLGLDAAVVYDSMGLEQPQANEE